MQAFVQVGCVALGSSLGGVLRWLVGMSFARWFGTGMPWGTFFINISGSFFLGWFTTTLSQRFLDGLGEWISKDNLHLMVAVGFTGAYTTFSTFEYESSELLGDGDNLKALVYVFGSLFLGLVAVRLGIALARVR